MSEHLVQSSFIQWFRFKYSRISHALFAIPNGAILCDLENKKRQSRMAYLYDEGFRPGVCDLFLAVPTNHYHGLFIEMKDENKTMKSLSQEQSLFMFDMNSLGYCARCAIGFDAAKTITEEYLNDYEYINLPYKKTA